MARADVGAFFELTQVIAALPEALAGADALPKAERTRRLRGVPLHLLELLGIGALRLGRFPEGGDGEPVVLLHGYAGHPKSHGLLRRYLHERGYCTYAVDMRGRDDVQGMGDALRDWILEHIDEEAPVPVVAHSLGGVIARFALRDERVRRRVSRLITLGSPHEGTRIAKLVESRKASQMERDAELREALGSQEPWNEELPPMVCFWSRTDLLMVPPEAAIAEGAEERELEGVTHYGYLLRSFVFEAVADALDAG